MIPLTGAQLDALASIRDEYWGVNWVIQAADKRTQSVALMQVGRKGEVLRRFVIDTGGMIDEE